MESSELQQRIQRYRKTYLEDAAGRKHKQAQYDERDEILHAYQEIQAQRKRGEDVTMAVLTRLLPHQDTQYNRERGAHISTWPCISKDVVRWFEGAKWKQSSDWPPTAQWILAMVEAGSFENWEDWKKLSSHPMQKGFACGFITPIVHCLNNPLPVINSKVVRTYADVAEMLGIRDEISASLIDYPDNKDRILRLIEQLKPLGISDLVEWDMYCHWHISKRLGGKVELVDAPDSAEEVIELIEKSSDIAPALSDVEAIIAELQVAQFVTETPARFEKSLATAFAFLGFDSEQIGGAGHADVIATASLGEDTFTIVIDAKTMQPASAKSKAGIDYLAVRKHQQENAADFGMIVAAKFAGGDTITNARDMGLCLVETQTIVNLLRHHAEYGISLYDIRDWLQKGSGLLDINMKALMLDWADLMGAAIATLSIFETHQRSDETVHCLTEREIAFALKVKGTSFQVKNIQQVIALLAHPLIAILKPSDDGYVMTLPASLAARRFHALANTLSTSLAPKSEV